MLVPQIQIASEQRTTWPGLVATPEQVETLFHSQINNDSQGKAFEAGDNWTTFPLSFFYSNEVSVDLAVKATMIRVLTLDHAVLTGELWQNLGDDIDLKTIVSDAIQIIAEISTRAVHP